ncbi:MAG: ThuA domain-containing protein, partial [Pedosphaera parvula]|nr:ThuA domain-containing protein [Pedosphaera parvula]
ANCATCHQLGDIGNLAGPPLTGMGAHGPAMLLGHILDPNREVDFSFTAWSIETRDGEIYDGIVTRESRDLVVLRNAAGEKEIPKGTIKSRRNTGRSLMPEGFESLGAAGLRDLLTFICGGESRFRFIDLRAAMTADSRKGIYRSLESAGESLHFIKHGVVNVDGVPFNLVDPARQPLGRNVMVLKGGGGIAKTEMPRKVEAGVGFAAKQLHFLGNVAGWGFPLGGGKVPALKVTAQYAGGAKEELQFENGAEFADYIREIDVPGSKLARGLVSGGRQVRLASRKLKASGIIEKLTFESFDNGLAPTTVAVTADLSDKPLPEAVKAPAPRPTPAKGVSAKPVAMPAPSGPMPWGAGTKVLLVGGGSSHDFEKFFHQADSATLKAAGCSVHYTEDGDVTARELAKVDVAVLSVNRKEWATPALRKALFDFANRGKGLVLLHPGLWYNFNDWPEYNRVLAGGGARGHDKLGEFTVNVLKRDHPVTQGVTPSFKIIDELYY